MHTRSNSQVPRGHPQGSIAQGQVRGQGDQEEVERRQDRSRRQEGQGDQEEVERRQDRSRRQE